MSDMIPKPALNRALNIALGAIYTVVVLATLPGSWIFDMF